MEWWQFVLIPLLGALAGIMPLGFYRYSLSQREDARRRRLLDCASDFRRLARDAGIEDSQIREEFLEVEARYQALLQEYEKIDSFSVVKK